MEPQARVRYEVVRCSVYGHAPYGLLIESEDGERGFVDSSYITDNPGEPWPAVGQQLRCVVLCYTGDGRLCAAAIPLYVEMVAAADDPAAAADQWGSLTGRGRQHD
ncbi:hypothetical protein [Nocardia arthritidis]|uniref:S1 motif domain-containing protein n=1 Tax=Nocardia arthritidis TaxID=228602 RepID=A0A6G9YA53_9NOCA|nr:hypothetical protein [Nocardia arthritidis]QIS10145.1 hypothetical protein F5544_11255 [Nocardia arthritidis]